MSNTKEQSQNKPRYWFRATQRVKKHLGKRIAELRGCYKNAKATTDAVDRDVAYANLKIVRPRFLKKLETCVSECLDQIKGVKLTGASVVDAATPAAVVVDSDTKTSDAQLVAPTPDAEVVEASAEQLKTRSKLVSALVAYLCQSKLLAFMDVCYLTESGRPVTALYSQGTEFDFRDIKLHQANDPKGFQDCVNTLYTKHCSRLKCFLLKRQKERLIQEKKEAVIKKKQAKVEAAQKKKEAAAQKKQAKKEAAVQKKQAKKEAAVQKKQAKKEAAAQKKQAKKEAAAQKKQAKINIHKQPVDVEDVEAKVDGAKIDEVEVVIKSTQEEKEPQKTSIKVGVDVDVDEKKEKKDGEEKDDEDVDSVPPTVDVNVDAVDDEKHAVTVKAKSIADKVIDDLRKTLGNNITSKDLVEAVKEMSHDLTEKLTREIEKLPALHKGGVKKARFLQSVLAAFTQLLFAAFGFPVPAFITNLIITQIPDLIVKILNVVKSKCGGCCTVM